MSFGRNFRKKRDMSFLSELETQQIETRNKPTTYHNKVIY